VTANGGNLRPLEEGVVREFGGTGERVNLSYGAYLHLDELLSAQHPVSRPVHHDELLFIVQHQTSELWLKLVLHELRAVRDRLRADELRPALKGLARVKHIQRQLTEQWSVLATLTPSEYAEFRRFLGTSSGFQSYQYRAVEFILGNKNPAMIKMFAHDESACELLGTLLGEPTVYDEFLRHLHRHGHAVPEQLLGRDVTQPYAFTSTQQRRDMGWLSTLSLAALKQGRVTLKQVHVPTDVMAQAEALDAHVHATGRPGDGWDEYLAGQVEQARRAAPTTKRVFAVAALGPRAIPEQLAWRTESGQEQVRWWERRPQPLAPRRGPRRPRSAATAG